MRKSVTKTRSLQSEVWSQKDYYECARKGSEDMAHPGMKLLVRLSRNANKILDLGCGEGTRLSMLKYNENDLVGVDISKLAIKTAQKRYPKLEFIRGNIEKTKFKKELFDLVYSAFVLEHVDSPEKVIDEAIRVTSKKGSLVLIAPNYGAPNRASPVYRGSRIYKFMSSIVSDLFIYVAKPGRLKWNKVIPTANKDTYAIDLDTTVEPYIGSLVSYLKSRGLEVELASTCWEQELEEVSYFQRFIKILSDLGIYPFYNWGPHIVVHAAKLND